MSSYLKQPIIFLGFGRCGSTIISEIIFQHYKLAWVANYQQKFPTSTSVNLLRNLFQNRFWRYSGQKDQLNEVPLLNKYIFKPAESYRFWNSITQRDFARGFLYQVEEDEQRRKHIRSFFADIVKYQGRERLAFKTTGPARLTYLHSLFPDAHFVYIRRKPLPNIRSLLKVGFYQEWKHQLSWKGPYTQEEQQAVENWKGETPAFIAALQYYKIHEVFEKEKNDLGIQNQLTEVFYEDFTKNPKETIDTVLDTINLEWDSNIATYFSNNAIYSRNAKDEYYISAELDERVLEIAEHGIG